MNYFPLKQKYEKSFFCLRQNGGKTMYKILEPIMVRMPLYSHEEYKKIDLFADVDKFIQIFSNRPSFLKAIAISSPDFYTSVIENEKNVVYSDKYRDSMLKYIFYSNTTFL